VSKRNLSPAPFREAQGRSSTQRRREIYVIERARSLEGTALCAGSDKSEQMWDPWKARINKLILAIKRPHEPFKRPDYTLRRTVDYRLELTEILVSSQREKIQGRL
jgi:hypothetical protein